ncbi:hypothetical protein UFOVP148_13 [uncultured Caudovirales phage]|uniref:Uncharacterized protein n=1 Tax=uncultured Caudovirales phage TaxID=2100421 RepID=A0A6J7WBY6_9CAUD|nr:hypothetical protein UFOVP148_13 [uncultured Caudovirales phage]
MIKDLISQYGVRMCDEHGETHGEELYCFGIDDITNLVASAIAKDREQLAKKIAQMPFGDTAASFALWIKEQP